MLDRDQWIEAVHALMQPTRGEFWAEVAAAQPPDDDEGEDLPDVRWTGEGGDFFISRSQGWLGVDIDGEESVAWLEEWNPETLRSLSEPVSRSGSGRKAPSPIRSRCRWPSGRRP